MYSGRSWGIDMSLQTRSAVGVAGIACMLTVGSSQASEAVVYQYDTLGRLVSTTKSGGPATGAQTSTSYDSAGNRTSQTVSGAGGGTPPPPPPPPPNTPPVANPDSVSVRCWLVTSKNVTANDTDADVNYPLTVISASSGSAINVGVESAPNIWIEAHGTKGTFSVSYTIRDSLGATAGGTLTVTVTGTTSDCAVAP